MELTQQQLEEMYVTKNMTYQEIADIIGKSVGFVQRRVKRVGLKPRPAGGRKGKALKQETIEKIRAKAIGKKFSEEWRKNISESRKGANNPNFGKKARHTKRIWYQCPDGEWVSMRSNWEVCYANYLTQNKITWKYEPETFLLKDGSAYTPDFLLTHSGEYIEVKGWFRTEHQIRINAFREQYPDKKLTIADKTYLEQLGIDLRAVWMSTRPKFPCELCGRIYHRKKRTQRFCGKACANKYIATHSSTTTSISRKRHYNGNQSGATNNSTKLTEQQVLTAVSMRENGATLSDIVNATGITMGNLGNILKGRSWAHVTGYSIKETK